jgi:hypothetical protein
MHAGGDGVAVGKNTAETIGIGGGGLPLNNFLVRQSFYLKIKVR